MRVAVTGTPGTGKTTAVEALDVSIETIHLNEVIETEDLVASHDNRRDTNVVDMDALEEWLETAVPTGAVVESHLAHHFDADRIVVLRAHPETIVERLTERGESPESARENAESEALDIILSEAVSRHGEDAVYEIDTTDRTPEQVAAAIEAVVRGEREPSVGIVSFVDYIDGATMPEMDSER